MGLLLSAEDSFNLKRIADALCKLASIEVLQVNEQPKELHVEVSDISLEQLAIQEEEARIQRTNESMKKDTGAFWPEDNLTLEELEEL